MDNQTDKAGYRRVARYAMLFVAALLFGIVLVVRIRGFFSFAAQVFVTLWPVTAGVAIAYLLSPAVRFFRHRVYGKLEKRGKIHAANVLAVCTVALLLLLFVALILWLLVPQLVQNYTELASHAEEYIGKAQQLADDIIASSPLFGESSTLSDLLGTDLESYIGDWLVDSLQFAGQALENILSFAGNFIGTMIKIVFSLILAFGLLLFEDKVKEAVHRFCRILLPRKGYSTLREVWHSFDRAFGGFFSGRILDSVLVGVFGLLVFYLTKMPYAPLLSILLCIFNMIPYFGSLIAGVVGGVVVLFAKPSALLLFFVIDILIEQIDGNLLGPKVLGESMGMRAIWVILSVTVFGDLFGFTGLLLAVPVTAMLGDGINHLLALARNARSGRTEEAGGTDSKKGGDPS